MRQASRYQKLPRKKNKQKQTKPNKQTTKPYNVTKNTVTISSKKKKK